MSWTADRLAVYTTMYPGVERYLPAWHRSLLAQDDRGFDLWIGLDGLRPAEVCAAVGAAVEAEWVYARRGDSPATLRAAALRHLASRYDAVVLVDSDDVLTPDRVSAARDALGRADVAACALRCIDADGADLGQTLGPPPAVDPVAALPRWNAFGLSNTAYLSWVLRACLPLPRECVAVDWLLATRAWACGASFQFDATARMGYRQHGANVVRVLPPFTPDDVRRATALVQLHYRCALDVEWPWPAEAQAALTEARAVVDEFEARMADPERLAAYVDALNRAPAMRVWWSCVARPGLEDAWRN